MNIKSSEKFLSLSGVLRLVNWWPFLAMFAVFILYFSPIIFEGNTLVYRDIAHFAYPMKLYIWKVWALGEWPYWYPNTFQGIPLMPLMHPGVFYPPAVFFLLKDFILAFNSYFLFHHLVLMFSVYALSRYWGRSKLVSIFSSVTALLGGYFLSLSSNYNQFHSVVWFPLILLFYQKYIEGKGIWYLLNTSILIAFQVLAGGPESAVLSVLIMYASSLFWMKGGRFIERTVQITVVVFFALGLSAIQWIPTYHFLEHLTRSEGVSFSYSTERSLELRTLADIVLPEIAQPFFDSEEQERPAFLKSIYMGLIPLFILLMNVMRFRKDLFARFWIIIFIAGVFFALGRNNPAYFYIYSWVPFFDLFRFPPKFYFLSAFALVFLSAHGLDHLMDQLSEKKVRWIVPMGLLLFLVALVILIFFQFGNAELNKALMILGLTAFVCLAIYFNKISKEISLVLLLLIMVLDLMGKNGGLVPFVDKSFYTEPPVLAKWIGGGADEFRIFSDRETKIIRPADSFKKTSSLSMGQNFLSPREERLILRDELHHNFGAIYNTAYADGIETMLPRDSALWKKIFDASKPDRKKRILMRSNVKYQVGDEYEVTPSSELPLGLKKVEEFENTLPRAFLVGRSLLGREPQLLNTYYSESFDPRKEVLLGEEVPIQTRSDFSGQVKKILYSPNKVRLLTEQNGEGFLVLLDTYFPGWKVEVDGKSASIYRANYFYRGVKLNAGHHVVEFSYTPEGLKTGLTISILTLVALLAGLIFFYIKNLRKER